MRESAFDNLLVQLLAEHPLVRAWLAVVFVLIILLGTLHVTRIFGRVLIVVVREFKHELSGIWVVVRDLAHEMTHWKSDP
jgi:hypothetical protein